MSKQEIIDAVEKGIAGQGTMVDLGGVLPKVLKAIVDALPEGASPIAPEPAIAVNPETMADVSFEEAAEQLGISVEELLSIPNQLVIRVNNRVLTRVTYAVNPSLGSVEASFGTSDVYFAIQIETLGRTVVTDFLV